MSMQLSIECFNSIDLVAVCKYYLSPSLSFFLSLFCKAFFHFPFFLVCGSGAEDFGKQKGETRIGSRSKNSSGNPFAKSTTGVGGGVGPPSRF
jgi:hypothetical protein